MSQPIDKMYVEIEARGEDKAARDIKKSLDRIARDIKQLSKDLEASFAEASRDIERELTEAGSILTKEAVRQRKEWQKTGTSLALAMKEASESAENSIDDFADEAVRDMDRVARAAARAAVAVDAAGSGGNIDGANKNITIPGGSGIGGTDRDVDRVGRSVGGLRGLFNDVRGAVRSLADELGERLSSGARQAIQSLAAVGGTISSILGPIGSFIASLGLLGAALLLAPVLIPLIAALSQLSGLMFLLPGAIGVLAAAITPLIMAFSGVGEAVSALASGDLDKINESMKKLSPQARKFAVEVHSIRDELRQLKLAVQDAFFKEFNGALSGLVHNTLPLLMTGLTDVSSALGNLGARLAEMLGTPTAIAGIRSIFDSATSAIEGLTVPLMDLMTSFFAAIKAAQPFLDRMFNSLASGVQKFADWLMKISKNGDLSNFLESAFTIAKDLWNLLKSIGSLFGAIFGGLGDEGDSFIITLTKIVDKMTEFFASAEGKQQVQDIVNAFLLLGDALVFVTDVISTVGRFFARVQNDLATIGVRVTEAWNALSEFFTGLWTSVQGIGAAVGEWFAGVGEWFVNLWDTILEIGGQILQWFADLPGKIGDWLASLPTVVSNRFQEMKDQIFYWIGYAFGWIVTETLALPDRIAGGLTNLWNMYTDWFTRTRDSVVGLVVETFNSVMSWINQLPMRIGTVLLNMWNTVSSWFTRTRNDATNTASSTVSQVVGWFQKLPGRAADAIRSLPGKILNILREIVSASNRIGIDIMEGIGRGIRNGWNAAINAAKDAARSILRGFWDAFEINSPSKLTMREVGAPIMEGVGLGVERGTPAVRDTINRSVSSATEDVTGGATSGAGAAAASGGGNGGFVIQNLSIPIQGTWDLSDPQATRRIAMGLFTALEDLKKDYR